MLSSVGARYGRRKKDGYETYGHVNSIQPHGQVVVAIIDSEVKGEGLPNPIIGHDGGSIGRDRFVLETRCPGDDEEQHGRQADEKKECHESTGLDRTA